MNHDWTQSSYFCDYPKAYGKIPLAFCRGNQFHANSRSAYSDAIVQPLNNTKLFFKSTKAIFEIQLDMLTNI